MNKENLFTENEKMAVNRLVSILGPGWLSDILVSYDKSELIEGVFRYSYADIIFKNTTEKEQGDIYTALILTMNLILLGLDTKDPLFASRWRESHEEVIEKTKNTLPELFERLDMCKMHSDNMSTITKELNILNANTMRSISAHINTDEELQRVLTDIDKSIDEFILNNKGSLPDSDYQKIIDNAEAVRSDNIEFAKKKRSEEPVKLYYYRTGSRVAVKLNINRSNYSYRRGRGYEIKLNYKEDRKEYPYIVSVSYIADFLFQNNIRDEDLWIDPRSVDYYYAFRNEVSATLSPSFVGKWWGCDCPNLEKHTPNKNRGTNMMGMPICHFTNVLVESGWTADYIDEDITVKEADSLTKDRQHTRLYQSMKSTLKAREIAKDKEAVEALIDRVDAFNKKTQEVIDSNKNEILEHLASYFNTRITNIKRNDNDNSIEELSINDNFGLDCGFIHIQTTDKEYMNDLNVLRQLNSNYSPWMRIRMPYGCQSITVKKVEFEKVKEIVLREIGIEIYAHAVLD